MAYDATRITWEITPFVHMHDWPLVYGYIQGHTEGDEPRYYRFQICGTVSCAPELARIAKEMKAALEAI
jgi:hypothetical protein